MQHKYKKIIVVFLMMLVISGVSFWMISKIEDTEWTQEIQNKNINSYIAREEIYTIEDYLTFVEKVNAGNDYQNCEVCLKSDLDFSNCKNLIPIGTDGEEGHSFRGTFNGNGYTISGVAMNYPSGHAGLFVNFGGILKNLQVKDSEFFGLVCGVVATDTIDAAILNCCMDVEVAGEVSGTIVGILNGKLRNCVSSSDAFAGEVQEGKIEQCYQKDCAEFGELNRNLSHLSGYYEDTDFCCWENGGINAQKADLLENMTARLSVNGVELKFSAYYSKARQSWCIALPATYGNQEVVLEAQTCQNGYESFFRNPEEENMIFTWEERYYPIDFLCDDNRASIYISLQKQKGLDYIHENKTEEIPGILTVIDEKGKTSYVEVKGFYGHGNDSWAAKKKSYNLKLESYADLLNMGENDEFALLSGYRNGSLMSYVATSELTKELDYAYAPEFRLVNLYVAGEYAGVYFLAEKVEIDRNRIELDSVYEHAKIENKARLDAFEYCSWKDENGIAQRYFYNVNENPKDITGGYLLEADSMDYAADDSRFVSDHSLSLTLKRAKYSSKEQVDYIADYWQEFEDALFAEDGYNGVGRHYSEYIDMESFAMQWLYYELSQDISLSSSIYFYKESNITGDGLLHACYPWDVEHSYLEKRLSKKLWLAERTGFKGYWREIYKHDDFQKELCKVWNEKYVPAIQKLINDTPMEYESGLKNLKWYQENIVGMHQLENSRWEDMYPWNRCGEIRQFLDLRANAITEYIKD